MSDSEYSVIKSDVIKKYMTLYYFKNYSQNKRIVINQKRTIPTSMTKKDMQAKKDTETTGQEFLFYCNTDQLP